MKFFGIRYFIIPTNDNLFETKEVYFNKKLYNRNLFTYRQKKYTIREFNLDEDIDFKFFYLLKENDIDRTTIDPISEERIDNWDKLLFMHDNVNNIFLFQKNNNIASPNNILNALNIIFNEFTTITPYEIKFEFITDEFEFWNILQDNQGVYLIQFELNSPNLFKNSKKANEMLKEIKEIFNNTQFEFKLKNPNNDLKYDKSILENLRDYADSGGGNWILGVIKEAKKKNYSSKNFIKEKEINFTLEDLIKKFKQLKLSLIKMLDEIDSLREQDG